MGNQFLFLSGAHGSRPKVAQGHHGLPQPGPRVASPAARAPPARGLRRSATRRTCPRSPPALAGRRGARTREADSEPTHEAARRGSRRPLPHRGARQPAPRWEPRRLRRTARAPPSPPPLSPPPQGSSQAEPLRSR